MEQKRLKDLKQGEFFTLKNHGEYPDEARVYVRDEYERSEKRYFIHKFSDVNDSRLINGNRLVFVGFTF